MIATNHRLVALPTALVIALVAGASSHGQDANAKRDPTRVQQTEFAPGVVTVIPPAPDPKETYSGPMTLKAFLGAHPELQWSQPNFQDGTPHTDPRSRTVVEMAKQVILRREIHCLEFSFKPLRQMYVDLPRADGRAQRKLVWYMVYRVRYRGGDLRPATDKVGGEKSFKRLEAISYESRRFFPIMYLVNNATGEKYIDNVLPAAKQKIAVREQISAPLHDSVGMQRVAIPYSSDEQSPGVWGVVTWEDIDPALDFLSVNVLGLTNAFEQDGEGDDAPYRRKALQLNFYRPGDAINQTDDEIRFGVPAFEDAEEQAYVLKQYGIKERLDYRWTFLPLNE
ncbi:hypothetical protein [Planctomycetes bacterium K23_9]|uniref:Secreted protein n=1 Tax=Stieleria marina TaxID=1930275 RepID=A0A517P2B2_9BACT|nr:hypothetical protein K239x_55390 [Planctomycetes bacterium K23_9]